VFAWFEYFARVRDRAEAEARARRTLLSLLTPAQRAQFEQGLGFDVTTRAGHRYRIRPGNTVQRLDPESGSFPLYTYCVRPDPGRGWLPEDDIALAQKLLLEADEETFLRHAIRGR
jgi:hypothetical protein